MIFSREQVALVRAGRITATIIPATKTPPKRDTVHPLWRRHTRRDENNTPIDTISEIVYDVQSDRPDQPIRLTIQAVHPNVPVDDLDQVTAHACGYKTANGLQDAWRASHPRTFIVHVIRFTVGDLRDRDRYLARPGPNAGDYTTNRTRAVDDLPTIRHEDLDRFTKHARERDLRRRKNPDQVLRDSLVERISGLNEDLEKWMSETKGVTDKERQGAIRGIRMGAKTLQRQLAVLDRKLKAA